MTASANSALKQALEAFVLPEIGHSLGSVGKLCRAEVEGSAARLEIELGFPFESARAALEAALTGAAKQASAVDRVELALVSKIAVHGVQPNLKPLQNVSNVVAVASGKGGDRKSVV